MRSGRAKERRVLTSPLQRSALRSAPYWLGGADSYLAPSRRPSDKAGLGMMAEDYRR